MKQDLKVCGLSEAGIQDRLSWRSSVKNSRQEPTPSNGSLPQSMAAPPARRVLGMRTRSFNKTGFDWLIDLCVLSRPVEKNVTVLALVSLSSSKTIWPKWCAIYIFEYRWICFSKESSKVEGQYRPTSCLVMLRIRGIHTWMVQESEEMYIIQSR